MAYNPNTYNPYGLSAMQPMQQQPINGIVRINGIEGAQMYPMPPNSVSPPLMLGSDNIFIVKTTDGGGAATLKAYKFEEIPVPTPGQIDESRFVTKEYFDSWASQLMEAINGKHVVSRQPEE